MLFKVNSQDNPWMNEELKQLKRKKMRQKNGKSLKYENLLNYDIKQLPRSI